MLESVDTLIATAIVILGLSLVVQALQQIVKQTLDLKSTYMRAELLALFGQPKPVSRLMANLLPVTRLSKDAGAFADRVVGELESTLRGFGFPDLHLVERMDARRFSEVLMALPVAADMSARADVIEALDQVDRWFETTKQAFQEHYERRMKYWAFVISAAVVVVMNASIIGIVRDFNGSRVVRAAVVAAAPRLMALADSPTSEPMPGGAGAAASGLALPGAMRAGDGARMIETIVAGQSFALLRWNTPSGDRLETVGDFIGAAARNWLGWLTMTLLVSLGAPFWYDVLKMIMGLKNRSIAAGESRDGTSAAVTPAAPGAPEAPVHRPSEGVAVG
jgi:hypothetical protein